MDSFGKLDVGFGGKGVVSYMLLCWARWGERVVVFMGLVSLTSSP